MRYSFLTYLFALFLFTTCDNQKSVQPETLDCKTCDEFKYREEALAYVVENPVCGNDLDGDNNGIYCDKLPSNSGCKSCEELGSQVFARYFENLVKVLLI